MSPLPPAPKSLLVLQRRQADVLLKKLRKVALIAKAQISRDLRDQRFLAMQRLTGRLYAKFDDEGLRTDAKSVDELPVQLPRRKMDDVRKFLHRHSAPEVLANVCHCAIELEIRLQSLAPSFIALNGAHDADEFARAVFDRPLVRREPVWNPLLRKE